MPLTGKRIIELRDLIERNTNNINKYLSELRYDDSVMARDQIAAAKREQIKLWQEQIDAARAEFPRNEGSNYDTTIYADGEEQEPYIRGRYNGGSKRRARRSRRAGRSRRARRSRRSRK